MTFDISKLKFDDKGLIPAIIQDESTGMVLMLGYMNKESLQKTLDTNETWFYSRSRQELWHKGATSGNTQEVIRIQKDCDDDTLLVFVKPNGPACHTDARTCFFDTIKEREQEARTVIQSLIENIKDRKENPVDGAYTTYLFNEGIDKVLKKVGEEATEVVIGAKNSDQQEVIWEVSDLIYHTLVLLEILDVSVDDIKKELVKRHIQKHGEQDE